MACQGCGRDSETRLCCPTCIELGQTSFFCGQECFAKNWAAHNLVHENIRRKKAEEEGVKSHARPPPKETSAYPRSMGAPLPGGMPLVPSFGSQKRSAGAAKKSDDAQAPAAGALSWMDQAKQIFGSKPREDARPTLRERSPAPARQPGGSAPAKPQAAQKARPAFTLQTALWLLVGFTVVVGLVLYMQHRRLADDPGGQAALTAAAAAVINVAAPAEEVKVADEGREKAGTDLRAELSALKDMVEKHEKMLRYVMDRYVEKELHTAQSEKVQGVVQATVANFSAAELSATSEAKSEARAGDAPRKRKAGADTSMVGMPQPESVEAAA